MRLRARILPRRIYTRAALLARGVHRREFAGGKFVRVLPGLWTLAADPAPLRLIAKALQNHARKGSVICHATAAELLGMPLPRRLEYATTRTLHCRQGGAKNRTTSDLITVHRMRPGPTVAWAGLHLSHPLEILRELARDLDDDELVICADSIAGHPDQHTRMSVAEMTSFAQRLRGPGSAKVRLALSRARDNVWSPRETRVRLLLAEHGFPEPSRNLPVADPDTNQRFYLDLAYENWKIAIEYDGDQHRTDRAQWQRDLHKNEVLHALGWTVLRISARDLRRPDDFFARLSSTIAHRRASS